MCVVDLGGAAPADDEPLLRDAELLDFVDQVAAVSPELVGAQEPVDGRRQEAQSTSPSARAASISSPGPTTGGLNGGLDGSPQSFATLPPWLVPDRVALRSCMDGILSDAESGDEFGAAAVSAATRRPVRYVATNVATCAPPPALSSTSELTKAPLQVAPADGSSSSGLKEVERSRRRRQRRKEEVTNLRERIRELEEELGRLQRRGLASSEEALEKAIVFNLVPMPRLLVPGASDASESKRGKYGSDGDDAVKAPPKPHSAHMLWKRIALHHKEELRSSRFKNLRLRALAEQQLRVLKQLEIAFRSAGRSTHSQQFSLTERAVHRGLFDSEAAVFESLRVHLSSQYMETNRVYKASGLAAFDGDMVQAGAPRVVGGVDPATSQVYVENMECKVFPFSIQAVNETIWHCLTNSDSTFHPGFYQIFEANEDIVTVKISDYVRLPQAETLVTVWMTVRRYQEEERVVTVWNAMVETQGSLNMKLHERGWNVLRPLLPTTARRNPSMCITQTLMRVSPVTSARFAVQDVAVGTLANVLIGCYHRTVVVMHHVLEKLLLTEFKTLTCGE